MFNHTPDVCLAIDQAATRGRWKLVEKILASDVFSIAFRKWIRGHVQHIGERTLADYQAYGKALIVFFDKFRMDEIDVFLLKSYQQWRHKEGNDDPDEPPELRQSKYRHAAKATQIKHEIDCCIKPIMKQLGLWPEIKKHGFRHLPIPKGEGAGIALAKEEHSHLLEVAFSRPKWMLAAHCLRLTYRTACGFGELRKLRRRDIDVDYSNIRIVGGAKVDSRVRIIALVPSAQESIKWIVARWQAAGGKHLDEYVLYHRTKGFSKPMGSIYNAWIAIKQATAEKYPAMRGKLALLRIYDGRVSVASWLLGNPKLSLPAIEKSLGWRPNSQMRERYHRQEIEDRRAVMATLEDPGAA